MNKLKIIFIYIGLIIGAGFASGREICEYFNFSSNKDFTGIILASFLFMLICYIIMSDAAENNIYSISSYIKYIFPNSKILRISFNILIFFDLVCGLIVMISSWGEFIGSIFDIPKIAASAFLCLICIIIFIFDIKGIEYLNLILVPIMISIILPVTIISIINKIYTYTDVINIIPVFIKNDRNILLMSICYVSYNTLTAASILTPLTRNIKNKRDIFLGSFIAGLIIGLLIFFVWFSISVNFKSLWYESFPLLKISRLISPFAEKLYSLCFMLSIITTSISEGYGILTYFDNDLTNTHFKRSIISLLLFIILLPFSMINFSYLVEKLYFVLGMIGTVWIIIIILKRYFK